MANFTIPNLCGASPELNLASTKIADLENEILSKIDAAASEAAAAFDTALADVKDGLDGLALDLPEVPNVNFQAELTSLINDIDKTTIEGIAAFNNKLAELEKDFGETLKEKGLELDKLITDATAAISSGGDVCALAPNLEIPAASSGTGVTTEELNERVSNATTITLTQTPKEILEVQGKKTNQNFFTNISYSLNGKIVVPKQTGTYSDIKVKYTVSLIKEKPVAVKQPTVAPEKETVSIVTPNTNAVDTKIFTNFTSQLTKLKTKSVLGLVTEKEKTDIQKAIDSIGSETTKAKMNADFAKANAFLSGSGPGTLSGEINSVLRPSIGENNTRVQIKATTPENASVVKKEVIKKVNPTTRKVEKVEVKKTEKAQVSAAGFTSRRVEISEEFYTSTLPSGADIDTDGFKLVSTIQELTLKQKPVAIKEFAARYYINNEEFFDYYFVEDNPDGDNNIGIGYIQNSDPPKVSVIPLQADSNVLNLNVAYITYETLEKLDPTVKG
mgnify:CR=1 FL=1